MMKTYDELFDESGHYKHDPRYLEILKLHVMLQEAEIPHVFCSIMDGWQVIYPSDDNARVSDAVEHCGSYGHTNDRLEIMGLLTPEEEVWDSVCGDLTAEDVFQRYKNHYEQHKEEI